MFFAEPTDHAIPFFQQTRSIPFKFLYFNRLLLLMVEVYHQDVPSDLRSTFKLTTDVHNYRGHLLILLNMCSIWCFQDRSASIKTPKYLNYSFISRRFCVFASLSRTVMWGINGKDFWCGQITKLDFLILNVVYWPSADHKDFQVKC